MKVIREDPKNPNLLYAGTEFALFVSFDRGGHWAKFGDLPTVAVDDILVHPRDHDLVIATHGRSLFIVDDIGALEDMSLDIQAKEAYLFPPRPVHGIHLLPGFADSTGKGIFRGENPPEGALLTFYLKSFTGEEAKITIKNAAGRPVAKFKLPGTPGLNRINWDLKPTKDLLTEYGGEGQKLVSAGEYTISLSYGEATSIQKIQVTVEPGVETR